MGGSEILYFPLVFVEVDLHHLNNGDTQNQLYFYACAGTQYLASGVGK